MKKFLKISLIALVSIFSFTHCCKNKLSDDTYFYVDAVTDHIPLSLYIDGDYKGELPYIATGGNYDHYELIRQQGLHLSMKTSSFKFAAKNAQGITVFSGQIRRGAHSANIASSSGSMELTQTPDFILIAFQCTPETPLQ